MKKIIVLMLLLVPMGIFAQQINIMSFNIRYNNPNDGINAWPNRIALVNGLLKFHEPDIFGLQEALHDQILDIAKELPNFEWIGVGRDDGKQAGEYAPIFFNKEKFILIENGHFWLSENCEKPGLGWDAACTRICTWGKLQSKVTGKQFFVLNTHFDHKGQKAREKSAILIRDKIEEMTYKNNLPVILTGDFNLTPDQRPISILKKYMSDSRDISEEPAYGPVGTFHGFKMGEEKEYRIDYIFVHGGIQVLKYATLSDNFEKRMPSDHLPVFVKLQLR